uniref:(California timema) hypothetical protein n=1 Tax=Timema californicum TaxID=61474 RepID=A0A7R9PCC0_TIMCA|nr:unnamed protein product [Timema californicum]
MPEVSTDTNPEIILSTSSSTPTTTSTTSTAPVTTQPHTHQSMSTSGQVLRLRGGSGPWEGYVEVQGSTPGWGLVCDDIHGWNILEANVVCRQLGYDRGAEFSWQGRPTEEDTLRITVGAVMCSGDEATLAGCRLSHNVDNCLVARDAVGVRCYLNSASHCHTEEVNFDGKCYFLVNGEDGGFTHGEAIHHCQSHGGHLLDINSQVK